MVGVFIMMSNNIVKGQIIKPKKVLSSDKLLNAHDIVEYQCVMFSKNMIFSLKEGFKWQ